MTNGEHTYCDKVIDHDRELGGVQAYLKTIIDGQKKLFERTDDLCEMHIARDAEEKNLRKDLADYKDHFREMIADEINKSLATALNGRKGTEEKIQDGPCARGPISGFLDRSWNKFLDNIGPIIIGLILWLLVWSFFKSNLFGEQTVGIKNFFHGIFHDTTPQEFIFWLKLL